MAYSCCSSYYAICKSPAVKNAVRTVKGLLVYKYLLFHFLPEHPLIILKEFSADFALRCYNMVGLMIDS